MTHWITQAACNGADTELFFPPHGDSTHGSQAKQICNGCPVVTDCLLYALTDLQLVGVWGATSHKQRRQIHRNRNRKSRAA